MPCLDYCTGAAYVTNIPTMNSILQVSKSEPYFWIDDLFVTGILVKKLPHPINIYDWSNYFLINHMQYETEILTGKFFSPQLMVAYDIGPEAIRNISKKFQICHERQCYQMIYQDQELLTSLLPPVTKYLPQNSRPLISCLMYHWDLE